MTNTNNSNGKEKVVFYLATDKYTTYRLIKKGGDFIEQIYNPDTGSLSCENIFSSTQMEKLAKAVLNNL